MNRKLKLSRANQMWNKKSEGRKWQIVGKDHAEPPTPMPQKVRPLPGGIAPGEVLIGSQRRLAENVTEPPKVEPNQRKEGLNKEK